MSGDTSDHSGEGFSNYLTCSLEERTVYWMELSTDVDPNIKKVFIEAKWSTKTLLQFWGLDKQMSVLSCIYKPFSMQNEVQLDQSYRVMSETSQYSADSLLYKVMSHGLPKVVMVETHEKKCGFMSTGEEYGVIGFLLIPVFHMKEGCIGVIEAAVRNTQDIFSSFFDFVVALKKEKDLLIFNQTDFGKDLAEKYGTPEDASRLVASSDDVDHEDNTRLKLTREYLTQQLSKDKTPVEIANEIGCTAATVRNNLKAFGISYTKYRRASYSKTETDTSMKK